MVYEHILITDNSDKTMKKAAHYFNWELSCAVQAFRNIIRRRVCLLVQLCCDDLTFCPNRDGVAPSDKITCESCGRIVSSKESYFRRYDAFRFKWYGECMECREKRKEKKLLKHSCIEKANKYGICTACGLVLPGSPLDV
jgi:hypothetical protein